MGRPGPKASTTGGRPIVIPGTEPSTATGHMRWEFPRLRAASAGVLSTNGGLVFSGSDEGNFFALDARTGKPLRDFQTGGANTANPYRSPWTLRQRIAIAANRVLYVFGL